MDEQRPKKPGRPKKPKPPGDRHKRSPLSIRLPERIEEQLEKLTERNSTHRNTEVVRAIRILLENEKLWPPPPKPPAEPPAS